LEHIPTREPDPKRRIMDRSDTNLERLGTHPRRLIDGCIRA
jgi:hypothetical protein